MNLSDLAGFLSNPTVQMVILFLFGLLVKYNPAFKNLPNALIPILNAILALLMKLAGGQAISASAVGSAGGEAVIAALAYDKFAKTFIETTLGWKKIK